jgi:hypothetical protein
MIYVKIAGLALTILLLAIAALTIWAAGKNSNRGNFDY